MSRKGRIFTRQGTGRLVIGLLAFVLALFPLAAWHVSSAQDPSPAPSGSMMPPENLPRVVGPGVLPDLMYM
ncbi:MAG: hypothetical protein ACKO9Q_16445, partial [Pirellula sp.]